MTAKREHLVQQVVERLRSDITQGRLFPGEKLYEQGISEQLGVSRTPVREALRQLESDGLVTFKPYKGVTVVKLDDSQVRDLFEVREALEGMAARLATERMPEATVDDFTRVFEAHKNRLLQGEDVLPPFDFHEALIQESANAYLIEAMNRLRGQIATLRIASVRGGRRGWNSNIEHLKILAYIRQRDGTNAELAMREHIRASKENVLRIRSVGQL